MAAKLQETWSPEVRELVALTDGAFSRQDVVGSEVALLNAVEFDVAAPTPYRFLQRMAALTPAQPRHVALAQFLLELALPDLRMTRHSPAILAGGAFYLHLKLIGAPKPAWPRVLEEQLRLREAGVRPVAKELCVLLERADKGAPAVLKKFGAPKFFGAAKVACAAWAAADSLGGRVTGPAQSRPHHPDSLPLV